MRDEESWCVSVVDGNYVDWLMREPGLASDPCALLVFIHSVSHTKLQSRNLKVEASGVNHLTESSVLCPASGPDRSNEPDMECLTWDQGSPNIVYLVCVLEKLF